MGPGKYACEGIPTQYIRGRLIWEKKFNFFIVYGAFTIFLIAILASICFIGTVGESSKSFCIKEAIHGRATKSMVVYLTDMVE